MRQASSSSGSTGAPPWGTAAAEAYAALALLAADPRIAPQRIAIVGFSFGGEVAHLSAFEGVRTGLATTPSRFAAHVSYYPAGVYGTIARAGAYSGARVLMLLGEKDDNLPVAKAEEYIRYAKGAAAPLDVSLYPDAYHAWTVPGLGTPRFYGQYDSTRKCPYILIGSARPATLVDGQERPLEPERLQACVREGRGYTMGYNESARAKAVGEVVDFLLRQLGP
jgi:dienelactone hydrolase